MRLNFSVPVIALLAGAAIGYCMHSTPPAEPEAEASATARAPGQISEATGDANVDALRGRIKELEALLADAAKRGEQAAAATENAGERRNRPDRFNPREMMERLKTEDPERYAQMTNRFARFRQHRSEQALSRLEYFAAIDLSALGPEAQETHSRIQTMIAKREEVEDRLHSETISDEEREAAMQEMFAIEREMRGLNRAERSNLISETVRELGYEGEDATVIAATIDDIIEATSSDFGPPHHGGGRGRGGRGERGGRGGNAGR